MNQLQTAGAAKALLCLQEAAKKGPRDEDGREARQDEKRWPSGLDRVAGHIVHCQRGRQPEWQREQQANNHRSMKNRQHSPSASTPQYQADEICGRAPESTVEHRK